MWINLLISVLAGIIVTIAVLFMRIIFYRVRDALPAGALFRGIKNVSDPCLVFIRRMTDVQLSHKFLTPAPNYSVASDDPKATHLSQFTKNKNIPWVTSTPTAQALAHVLNVLGRIGRTDNVEVTFADTAYDRWDVPMIIIGGSCKSHRALSTCNPYFRLGTGGFALLPTNETFPPASREEDMGLLQKMTNPTNGQPIWLIHGYRGAGVVAASYSLVRWWRHLGWLYGKKPFGLLVVMNDRDGWQQSRIISLYPRPIWFTKIIHFRAWRVMKRAMRN